jgi:hypothetical protein
MQGLPGTLQLSRVTAGRGSESWQFPGYEASGSDTEIDIQKPKVDIQPWKDISISIKSKGMTSWPKQLPEAQNGLNNPSQEKKKSSDPKGKEVAIKGKSKRMPNHRISQTQKRKTMLASHFPKTSETQTTANIERQIKTRALEMSKAHSKKRNSQEGKP